MALIDFTLAPAWKRIVTDDETLRAEMDLSEEPTTPSERSIPVESGDDEESTAPKRRRVTLRRVLALGLTVGAVATALRLRGVLSEDLSDPESESTIDVEMTDEAEAEQ